MIDGQVISAGDKSTRRSPRRGLRAVVVIVSALVIIPSAFLTLGTFVPGIPYLGAMASLSWPTVIGPALLFVGFGTLLAVIAYRMGSRRPALVLAVVGAIALLGTSIVFGNQAVIAAQVGVPVTPAVFGPLLKTAVPDESVTYMTDRTGTQLAVDVYRPNSDSRLPAGGAPIVMYVHGGGWIGGDAREVSADMRWFADQGYLVLSAEYSIATSSNPTWDQAMPQIGCALIWAAEHASEYGADEERIAIWGSSAGANIAVTTAYAAASGELEAACDGTVPSVSAVGGEVPALDPAFIYDNPDPLMGPATRNMVATYIGGSVEAYPERLEAIQAATYISADAPPTLLTVSDNDHLVPVESVKRFVEQAEAQGVEITALYRPWADHAISSGFGYLPNQTMIHILLDYFRQHGV
jgi:acetyl esterase